MICLVTAQIEYGARDPELVLGQSYFIPPKVGEGYSWTKEQFKNQFNFVLLPTIKEYSFNEPGAIAAIVGDRLGDGILEVDEFWSVFKAEFAY